MIDMRKKFEEMKRQETARLEKKSRSVNEDPRIIKWSQGNTYRLRLLFTTTDKRDNPFINKNVHSYYNEETKESAWVTCPTSEYLEDLRGFNSCPTCKKLSVYWKESQAGSVSAGELYKQFKRRFYGFAPVFVVSDSANPDNNGKVMIMKYGFKIYEYLKLNIWGVNVKSKQVVEGDELIGPDAFDLKSGYDLIVSVTANNTQVGKFNAYNMSFSKKQTAVPLSEADVEKAVKEFKFDEDFCTQSSKADLENFYNSYVFQKEIKGDLAAVKSEDNGSIVDEEAGKPAAKEDDAMPILDEEFEKPTPAEKPVEKPVEKPKPEPKKVEVKAPAKKEEPKPAASDDDIDIDELLKTVDEKYK